MEKGKQFLSWSEIKGTDLVDYLSSLGHEPKKIRNNDYWYLSPLREEKTPSFKINRKMNCWYDHGTGKGGNIVEFISLYTGRSPAEILASSRADTYLQKSKFLPGSKSENENSPLLITGDTPIRSLVLIRYLHRRNIPLGIACRYCREISFRIRDRSYFAIGFKNDSGGYELRNEFLKISSSPKDITTCVHHSSKVAVFEGFMDFLSMDFLLQDTPPDYMDYCILNSLSLFERARPFLEDHERIHLFLDNDKAGTSATLHALTLHEKYSSESDFYRNYKDLNDWIINMGKRKAHPS
jgi:hypothetical protein